MFGTLVSVSVFSVIWSELLMTFPISCAVVINVRVPESGVCVHISGEDECGMFVMCCMSESAVL